MELRASRQLLPIAAVASKARRISRSYGAILLKKSLPMRTSTIMRSKPLPETPLPPYTQIVVDSH